MRATHKARKGFLEPAFTGGDKISHPSSMVRQRLDTETDRLVDLANHILGLRTYGVVRRICTFAGRASGPYATFEDRTLRVVAPNAASALRLADEMALAASKNQPVFLDPRTVW